MVTSYPQYHKTCGRNNLNDITTNNGDNAVLNQTTTTSNTKELTDSSNANNVKVTMKPSTTSIRAFLASASTTKTPTTTSGNDNNKTNTNTNNTNNNHNPNSNNSDNDPVTTNPTPTKPKTLATKYCTAWNCTFPPPPRKGPINMSAALSSMMKVLCNIEPDLWIKAYPKSAAPDAKITSENDVPNDVPELDHFLEDPRFYKNGKLATRIHFVTNTPMKDIIIEQPFRNWLQNTRVSMIISELETPRPVYVGFFDEIVPSSDRIPLFRKQIEDVIETSHIKYQIITHPVYAKESTMHATFYMVLGDKNDNNDIQKAFKHSKALTGIQFYPWNQYASINAAQQAKIVLEQDDYNNMYRCAVIDGFTCEDTPMKLMKPNKIIINTQTITICSSPHTASPAVLDNNHYSPLTEMEEDDKSNATDPEKPCKPTTTTITTTESNNNAMELDNQENLLNSIDFDMSTLTVAEFISCYYLDSYGERMFHTVKPPTHGKIQLYFLNDRRHEVEALLPLITIETARFMTETSIDAAFTEPNKIKQAIESGLKWEPFTLSKEVPEIVITNPYSDAAKKHNRKRTKTNNAWSNPYTQTTYQNPNITPHNPSTNNLDTHTPTTINNNSSAPTTQQTLTSASAPPSTGYNPTFPKTQTEYVDIGYLEQRLAAVQTECNNAMTRTETKLTTEMGHLREKTTQQIEQSANETKTYLQTQFSDFKEEHNSRLDQHQQKIESKLDAILHHVRPSKDINPDQTQQTYTTAHEFAPSNNITMSNLPLPPNKTKIDTLTTTPNKERSSKQQKVSNTIEVTMNMAQIASPKTLFPSERAATPSEQDENRSDRHPLAVKQH